MPTFTIYQQGDPSVGIWDIDERDISLGQVLSHVLPYYLDHENKLEPEDQTQFLELVDRLNNLEINEITSEDDCFRITRLT